MSAMFSPPASASSERRSQLPPIQLPPIRILEHNRSISPPPLSARSIYPQSSRTGVSDPPSRNGSPPDLTLPRLNFAPPESRDSRDVREPIRPLWVPSAYPTPPSPQPTGNPRTTLTHEHTPQGQRTISPKRAANPNKSSGAKSRKSSCELCHRRKIRCDQLRPACSSCLRKGHQCDYSQEAENNNPYKENDSDRPVTQRSHPNPNSNSDTRPQAVSLPHPSRTHPHSLNYLNGGLPSPEQPRPHPQPGIGPGPSGPFDPRDRHDPREVWRDEQARRWWTHAPVNAGPNDPSIPVTQHPDTGPITTGPRRSYEPESDSSSPRTGTHASSEHGVGPTWVVQDAHPNRDLQKTRGDRSPPRITSVPLGPPRSTIADLLEITGGDSSALLRTQDELDELESHASPITGVKRVHNGPPNISPQEVISGDLRPIKRSRSSSPSRPSKIDPAENLRRINKASATRPSRIDRYAVAVQGLLDHLPPVPQQDVLFRYVFTEDSSQLLIGVEAYAEKWRSNWQDLHHRPIARGDATTVAIAYCFLAYATQTNFNVLGQNQKLPPSLAGLISQGRADEGDFPFAASKRYTDTCLLAMQLAEEDDPTDDMMVVSKLLAYRMDLSPVRKGGHLAHSVRLAQKGGYLAHDVGQNDLGLRRLAWALTAADSEYSLIYRVPPIIDGPNSTSRPPVP
ncbi:hypothetical protein TREMEDRAFT_74024 [Tremella mesenterica DSM 1558]|uniref:uncharacterized protein n=1 Tax=Tremella mesenterica (strain ATCC 24925 / CBS 8224 / DSM 1558 / NBRC 9311 / NRRL Y-6157 / RJB 2259-6 / UBC 559-6) TaxID=578456 RepID=UPI0003F492FC|nr:uncharacterized protein TREMEDRAFT_74024 [Tremella mesenterica DSM 1558]EIW69083.1 hypothetical protein TREMEDRAFT_74024 [Tremella mesenterica DSM 1558]